MHIVTVEGRTRYEALAQTRKKFGADPLILSVEEHRDFKTPIWRVMVATESAVNESFEFENSQQILETHKDLREQLRPFYERLCRSGYDEDRSLRVLRSVIHTISPSDGQLNSGHLFSVVRNELARTIPVATTRERLHPGIVIFAGERRVGKTTIATQLLADLCLGGVARPRAATLGSSSIVNSNNFKRSAEQLGIKHQNLKSPHEFRLFCVENLQYPIIVDTCIPDSKMFAEFIGYAVGHRDDIRSKLEIHGVVNAKEKNTFEEDNKGFFFQKESIQQLFNSCEKSIKECSISKKRISVTRVDQTTKLGKLIRFCNDLNIPLGYFSEGEGIPDDIVRPSSLEIAERMLAFSAKNAA